uniref:Uncharacterized protein n=1 Tax=Aureoumbra lagunensis TaxID=44058 RepID=A0A7S3JQG8_9STRA|mmetsp:Transcript_22438/g.29086  ORF Transcript_22438/g.29086 Transcript_22438/m.29086 type:complete len:419 (-) Transcript_22438:229-1485(-)
MGLREIRKFFAALTGLHGFFSGKKKNNKFQKTETVQKRAKEQQERGKQRLGAETKKAGLPPATRKSVPKTSVPIKQTSPPPTKKAKPAVEEKKQVESTNLQEKKVVQEKKPIIDKKKEVRSKPVEPTPGMDMKAASAIAMARLGLDPTKLATVPRNKNTVKPTSPEKKTRRKVEPEPIDVEQNDLIAETQLHGEEKKEEVEVDDTLARIDALLNPKANVPKEAGADIRVLLRACEKNDVAKVAALIESGIDVNGKDPRMDNYTALFIAVEDGDTEIADMLIEAGADIEARDGKGRTPLFAAAVAGVAKMVAHLIIQHHANPNVRDSAQHHVFWACCALSQINAARALLDASNQRGIWSIDINAKDPCGLNALDFAKARGNQDVIDFLSQRGANESRSGNVKLSAVQYELLAVDNILKS